MLIIDVWKKDRLEERRFGALPARELLDFAMLAGVLKTEAETGDPMMQVRDADVTA